MKKAIATLLLAMLSTQFIVCSELYDFEHITSKITGENCKKIVRDNPGKILGIIGTFGGLIMARYFYLQNRMILQEIVELRNEMYNGKMNGQDIDRLHEILMQNDIDAIIKDLQKFLGHTETIKVGKLLEDEAITFDNILGKIHICWHNPIDNGKPELNRFEELLWRYNKKYKQYKYPHEIEVHYKNRRLECILLPLAVQE